MSKQTKTSGTRQTKTGHNCLHSHMATVAAMKLCMNPIDVEHSTSGGRLFDWTKQRKI